MPLDISVGAFTQIISLFFYANPESPAKAIWIVFFSWLNFDLTSDRSLNDQPASLDDENERTDRIVF